MSPVALHDEVVSVVLTVLNEENAVGPLLRDLLAQDRSPDEIVVVDGGSTDGTRGVLRQMAATSPNVRLIELPGATISAGRNRAIAEARGDVVAVTDAGVRLAPDWLRLIVAPLLKGHAEVVAGFFRPDPQSTFERAMGAAVLPESRDIDPARFLPSSRSIAFRKSAWRQVGGYPEWLDYCEDLIFDLALRHTEGIRIVFEPAAAVYFRPRSSLRAFFRQYYQYARGDGKADLWPRRHAARYATYAGLLALIAITCRARAQRFGVDIRLSSRGANPLPAASGRSLLTLSWLAAGLASSLYLRRPLRRLRTLSEGCTIPERAQMLTLLPLIRLTGDVAKMAGYPVGRWWRLKHRPPAWRK